MEPNPNVKVSVWSRSDAAASLASVSFCPACQSRYRFDEAKTQVRFVTDDLAIVAYSVSEDVVVDGDLVTARTGGHCHLFAHKIIELLGEGR